MLKLVNKLATNINEAEVYYTFMWSIFPLQFAVCLAHSALFPSQGICVGTTLA